MKYIVINGVIRYGMYVGGTGVVMGGDAVGYSVGVFYNGYLDNHLCILKHQGNCENKGMAAALRYYYDVPR